MLIDWIPDFAGMTEKSRGPTAVVPAKAGIQRMECGMAMAKQFYVHASTSRWKHMSYLGGLRASIFLDSCE